MQSAIGPRIAERADHVGAAFDFAVQAFDRVGAVQLGAVCLGKSHKGPHIGLHVVYHGGELGGLWAQLIGNLARLRLCAGRIFLGEGGADEGGNYTAALSAGMG